MEPSGEVYRLGSESRAREALKLLHEAFPARPPRRTVVRLTFLDTFDARAHRHGGRLAVTQHKAGRVFEWEPAEGARAHRCAVDRIPDFVWDLPRSKMRDALEKLVEMRRLLPLAEVRLDCRELAILDVRRKTVARLRLEGGSVRDPQVRGRRRRLEPVLRLLPVRGYRKERRRLAAWIEERLALPRGESSTLTRALAALGRCPTDGYRKPGYPLQRGMRCDEAMKSILRTLLGAMLLNEEGTRSNLDTEFLHDFRVAVRRTRSALGQVPGVFPRATRERFRKGFSWLGDITGPLRDLDVQLLRLREHRLRLPEDLRDGLDPWEAWLLRQHRASHRRLVAGLATARYRRLVQSWRDYLDAPVPTRSTLANAVRPVEQVAAERIRRAHRRVLKKGKAIDDDSPPELLHRLRIECKKLRYLLEFFAGLYRAEDVRPLIGALKKLQNNLGDFNDYVVEQRVLARFLEQMPADRTPEPERAREAATRLGDKLRELQISTRNRFRERFEAFASRDVVRGFKRVYGRPPS